MERDEHNRAILTRWNANAAAWTTAVRNQLIPSRRAGTDAAIIDACTRLKPERVLDVGCGEGWLTRALAATVDELVGIDGSPALVAQARAAGGRFEVLDYQALINDPSSMAGRWDVIVCNFALFGDPLAPLLAALAQRLASRGRLIIQTVHLWTVAGEGRYANGWREETFADFGVPFPAPMPWYFRTLQSWTAELQRAGLHIERVAEPLHNSTGQPLSLILQCRAELP
jgi:SAM-dependent methyltransferase